MAGISFDMITAKMALRRSADSSFIRRALDIRARYNNDLTMVLPNVQDEPLMQGLMPQLLHDGIEGTAMRAAGQLPSITCPAINMGSNLSVRKAATRRKALYGKWDESFLDLLLRRAFRHLVGYGTFCLVVQPDMDQECARVELRDPLTSYPELRSKDDMLPPENVGFVFGRSVEWIARRFPQARDYLAAGQKAQNTLQPRYSTRPPETLWDVVEWIDGQNIVIGILGPRSNDATTDDRFHSGGLELARWDNRAGMVPVAVPRRITLDRIMGQLEQIVPAVDWMHRITALEVLAAEKDIYPDIVVLGADQNQSPELAGGAWVDGRTGGVNLITGAKGVQVLHEPPGPQTQNILASLERAGRMAGGVSPLYGGDNPNSLRTGRAIDTIGSFAVDPQVAEVQSIMARALSRSVNPAIMEIEKGYWPSKKFTVFSGVSQEPTEYIPERDFETTANMVTYSFPGTDINQISVALAQLVGAGMESKTAARRKHPLIDDPDESERQIVEEQIRDAVLAGFAQQAQGGQIPPNDAARVLQLVTQGVSVEDAITKAHDEAQQRQAQQVPPQAPEAQPGLAQPGMGAEATPTIAPPPAGLQDFHQLATALRSPSLTPGRA